MRDSAEFGASSVDFSRTRKASVLLVEVVAGAAPLADLDVDALLSYKRGSADETATSGREKGLAVFSFSSPAEMNDKEKWKREHQSYTTHS
jgi:hypothetical protein